MSPTQSGRLPICSSVTGLEVLATVVADGGRIYRAMTSLPGRSGNFSLCFFTETLCLAAQFGPVLVNHNPTPRWTIDPYCYNFSRHTSPDISLASGPSHLLHALMFHSGRVRLLLGYADARPSLSIWRGAVKQGGARLHTLCVWSLLSLPCSVSRFFLGAPVHPTSVLLQFAFGMPLGFPCLVRCTGCLTALLGSPRSPMGQAATKIISELLRSFRLCKNITNALHTFPFPAEEAI